MLGALNIGAFFPLLFLSAYRLPGGLAAVVGSTGPLLVLGLSALLLGRRPALRDVLAGAVAAFGVSMVVLKAAGALDTLGVAAAFASTASMSAGTVLTQKWGRPEGVGPLALTGWQLTAGGLLIAPLAFLVEGAPPALDAGAAGGYAYLALVNTAVAYCLWFRGIGRLTATQATLLGPLSPLTAAVLGWAALGESLTALQLAGMALAFGATVAGQLTSVPARRRDRARAPTPMRCRAPGRASWKPHRQEEPVSHPQTPRRRSLRRRRGWACHVSS